MSLSWRDRIVVELGPGQVRLRRYARGLTRRMVGEAHAALESGEEGGVAASLALLSQALERAAWRNADVEGVISNHWTRYVVVPWTPALNALEERRAYAEELFVGTFGKRSGQWELCLSDLAPNLTQVAAGIDPALINGLRETIARHGMRLVSLVPHQIAVFNRCCARLPSDDAWFVTVEPGMLCAAPLVRGGWGGVHSLRIGAQWGDELRRLVSLAQVGSMPRLLVDAPASLRSGAGTLTVDWLSNGARSARAARKVHHL